MEKSRVILRIEVLPAARDRLGAISDSLGLTHVSITSRLVQWLADQPDMIQAKLLGLLPDDVECDVPTMMLKQMASERKSAG